LSSSKTVSSIRDFGVEQFFQADEFRADDPSPIISSYFKSNMVREYRRGLENALKIAIDFIF
jgi:hypothetical protein